MVLAAILGGIFGLSIAWGMNYYSIMRDEQQQARVMAEVAEIRKSYRKPR
jgi:hypothetical protein